MNINDYYININKERDVAIFSPYLDDKNFNNSPLIHYSAAAKLLKSKINFSLLKDEDRTFFLYKENKDEELWDDILKIATFFDVSYFYIKKDNLQDCQFDFINNKLSLEYEEVPSVEKKHHKFIEVIAEKDYIEIHPVEFRKVLSY